MSSLFFCAFLELSSVRGMYRKLRKKRLISASDSAASQVSVLVQASLKTKVETELSAKVSFGYNPKNEG